MSDDTHIIETVPIELVVNGLRRTARVLPHDWHAFDNRFLHFISIHVAPEHLASLEYDREQRIPCDISINGVWVRNAGLRQKGGGGSVSPLSDKPGWSLKFDEFVKQFSG